MTDQEPTPEELQKFWEKFGFKFYNYPSTYKWTYRETKTNFPIEIYGSAVEYPDGQYGNEPPPLTLDNLFKYAVKNDWQILFWFDSVDQTYGCTIGVDNKDYEGGGNTRVVALFRAIQEAIK